MKYLGNYCVYLLDAHTYLYTYTIGLEYILHYYTIYPHSINSSNFPTKGESQFFYLVSTSIVYAEEGKGGEGQFPYLISTSIVYTEGLRLYRVK